MTLFNVKPEYKTMVKGVCELLSMKLYCENQSVIKIVKNPVQHDWTKHMEINHDFFFTRS